MFPSYLEVEKNWFLVILSLTNTVAAIWSGKKSGSLLFGDQKMQFPTVRSKEKDYDIYLKSEKTCSQPVGTRKKCFPAIWRWKKLVPSYFEPDKHCCSYFEREKKWIPAIWIPKNVVHNCQEHVKKIMTSI